MTPRPGPATRRPRRGASGDAGRRPRGTGDATVGDATAGDAAGDATVSDATAGDAAGDRPRAASGTASTAAGAGAAWSPPVLQETPVPDGGVGLPPVVVELVRNPLVYAALVLVVGAGVGYLVGRLNVRILETLDVPDAVEGTPFERTAQSLGTSTVGIVARLTSWFVYAVTILVAVNIAGFVDTRSLWNELTGFVPQLFIAALVLVVGFVLADKAELLVGERLRGVKLPEMNLAPRLVKYSVLYVAALVALGQIGVRTLALVALLTVYAFALVLFAGLAFKDFLSSAAAGVYLILNQPYGIGDEVRIGDRHGVVQGMDVFVTRIENDEQEYIVPNRLVLEQGVARARD